MSVSAGAEVVVMGETMALFSSRSAGVLRSGAKADFSVGGAESNVAIGLARLGVPVAWIGRVGVDPFGDEIVRVLRGEGVEVLARRDGSRRTGLMVKERRTALHQRVVYYRSDSAGSALSPDDVDDRIVGGARVLHVTGITPALSESATAAVDHAIDAARAAGTTVSLDVNYRSALWSRDAATAALTRLLPSVDILFAGLEEAELLTGRASGPEQAADLSGALRAYLRESLPEYMVPAVCVPMKSFPLSPAGKTDRRALPPPVFDVVLEQRHEPPTVRSPLENELAEIWQRVLGIDRVGTTASFFDIGGDSLLGLRVINQLRDRLGEPLSLILIFEAPTIVGLAEKLARSYPEAVARVWGMGDTRQFARANPSEDVETTTAPAGGPPTLPSIVAISRDARRMKRSVLTAVPSDSAET